MRHAVWLIMIVPLLGCSSNQANFNPFGAPGPSVMPPPSTGTAGRPDPYYRPAAPGANPAAPGGYGVGWNGQSAAATQTARFTSENAGQTQVADQRAGYANPVNPGQAPGYSPPSAGAPGYSQPAAASAYQPAALNPAVSAGAPQLPPSQPGFTTTNPNGLGQY